MSTPRVWLLSLVTCLLPVISPLSVAARQADTEAAFSRMERLRKIVGAFPEEMLRTRTIFEEALTEGVRTGAWSEAERTNRLKRVEATLLRMVPAGAHWYDDEQLGRAFNPGSAQFNPGLENSPTFALTKWLHRRLLSLHELRSQIHFQRIAATLEYAELQWLEAGAKADLVSAIGALEDSRSPTCLEVGDGDRRQSRDPTLNLAPKTINHQLVAYDFLTVLASKDPFFLPKLDADPESAAQGFALWDDLRNIKHSLVLRPTVRQEFAARRDRFLQSAKPLFAELDQSILSEAGSKKIAEQVAKIVPYTVQKHVLRYRSDRALQAPRPDRSPIDFRDLPREPFYLNLEEKDPTQEPRNPAVVYRRWVEMLQAEEAGDQRLAKQKWDQNREGFAVLPEPVSAYMMTRYAADNPRQPVMTQAAFDLAPTERELASGSFIETLRRVASSTRQGRPTDMPDLSTVLRAWEIWKTPDSSAPLPDLANAPWRQLATLRGGAAFLAFRDRAAREEIARVAGARFNTQPGLLPVAIRQQIGDCTANDQFDQAKQILRIAAIAGALAPAETARYSITLDTFSRARAMAEASPKDAANLLRTTLREMPDPTLGEIAARRILQWQSSQRQTP